MRDIVLPGRKTRIAGYLLLLIALLSGSWVPVLVLIAAALVLEHRRMQAAAPRSEVAGQ